MLIDLGLCEDLLFPYSNYCFIVHCQHLCQLFDMHYNDTFLYVLYMIGSIFSKTEQMAKGSKLKLEDKLPYEQDSHVSKAILNGVEPVAYRCINTNPDKDIWELTNIQKEIVRDVGLANISEIDYMRIDHALISGLVERWKPETNTFHLPTSEATVTLEDVAYIYGLPIDGIPVTG